MIASRYMDHLKQLRTKVGDSYLTDREKQIVDLLSQGDSPKQIAFKLGIAEPTVHSFIRHAKHRLKTRTTHHLIAICAKEVV